MRRRFLFWAGAAAVALLLLATALVVLLDAREPKLLPADTPAGVVQRYLLAVEAGDAQQAFEYLTTTVTTGTTTEARSLDDFRRRMPSPGERRGLQVVLDSETVRGEKAEVQVYFSRIEAGRGSILGSPVSQWPRKFELVRDAGEWRITGLRYSVY